MLLNWCCSLNILNAEKLVVGHVKKSITSSFFNRIKFYLAIWCRTLQEIKLQNFELKFQTVAEKTAKIFRGYFFLPHLVYRPKMCFKPLMDLLILSYLAVVCIHKLIVRNNTCSIIIMTKEPLTLFVWIYSLKWMIYVS